MLHVVGESIRFFFFFLDNVRHVKLIHPDDEVKHAESTYQKQKHAESEDEAFMLVILKMKPPCNLSAYQTDQPITRYFRLYAEIADIYLTSL